MSGVRRRVSLYLFDNNRFPVISLVQGFSSTCNTCRKLLSSVNDRHSVINASTMKNNFKITFRLRFFSASHGKSVGIFIEFVLKEKLWFMFQNHEDNATKAWELIGKLESWRNSHRHLSVALRDIPIHNRTMLKKSHDVEEKRSNNYN